MTRQEELRVLHEKWIKDCRCDLKKTATLPVPGDGSADAEIVFIGEAPGKQEDELGVPFVGAAGKFLDKLLQSVGIKREDIYITNIVKYRPPNNRDPEPSEKNACRDWLIQELNLIQPKLIVFLGRHSMNDFFPDQKISEVHGKLLIKKPARPDDTGRSGEFKNIKTKYFLPLYHPAVALYNGGMRKTLINDFKKVPKILEKIKDENKK